MNLRDFLTRKFNIDSRIYKLCADSEADVSSRFSQIDSICELNQLKVLYAMQKNMLSDIHFAATTGYGYNDIGRETLECIYADVFNTEAALVRPQIISGTHALTVALFGNLRHGDELVYVTGRPYETLAGVIGIRKTRGSLTEHGITYKQVNIKPNGISSDTCIDYDEIEKTVTSKTKMVAIQRSKGYELRPSLHVDEIAKIIKLVKQINPHIICMVDNCYGEFVEALEPGDVGADLTVGSLIKNPGGGLAPVGGYLAGKQEYVDNAAYKLTAPGLGREVGPTLGVTPMMIQGMFLAPQVVASSVKSTVFASVVFKKLGFEVMPEPYEERTDIVQAISMKSAENVIAFCEGIQKAAPVDSFVTPKPAGMPGYDCPVIMAAGTFVQGSSIELSADAPIKEPYAVFLQGGLTWAHAKIGLMIALNNMLDKHLISL